MYRGAKWFTPGFVRSRVENVEGWVTKKSKPFGNPLDSLLTVVDNEIDSNVFEPVEYTVNTTRQKVESVVETAVAMSKYVPGGSLIAKPLVRISGLPVKKD